MLDILTSTDYKVLQSIVNINDKRGICKGRGTTKKQIRSLIKMSTVTIDKSLKKLFKKKYIDFAIKKGKENAYCITTEGVKILKELTSPIFDLTEEE